jgi:hypothetical protein
MNRWTYALWLGCALGWGGCGKKYWEPTAAQQQEALALAQWHVFCRLSDQSTTAEARALAAQAPASGQKIEYPIAFTVKGAPYSRYRQKFWGGLDGGARLVHVLYFDPTQHPDWESALPEKDAFPAYFEVIVNLDARTAH